MTYPATAPDPYYQQRQDEEHLRLLSLFHYIAGGLTALFSCLLLIYFIIGLAALSNPGFFDSPSSRGEPSPAFLGWLFTLMGGIGVLLGWTFGGLTIYAGRCIAARKKHTFIFIMAILNCLSVPVGTTLGVFTLIVINRPSVKALFDAPGASY